MFSSAMFNEANANRVETSNKQKNCPQNGTFYAGLVRLYFDNIKHRKVEIDGNIIFEFYQSFSLQINKPP